MFDITLADGTPYRESDRVKPGDSIVTVETELGIFGMSICYDVRFPEIYRLMALRGAQVIFVPASFTMPTGKDHWEVLLRARAIENGCYIVAPGQIGQKPASSFKKRSSSSSLEHTFIAAPESTYDGRTRTG